MHSPLVLPGPIAVVKHALPNLVEGKLIPLLLFVGFLEVVGVTGALITALGWSVACLAYRYTTGRKVPALVVLSAIGLGARTILALATGSVVVYFLQPTLATALVGLAFLVSLKFGTPLAERLAHDFCPFDAETAEHPLLKQFFLQLSLLWALMSMLNAALTLYLLFTQGLTTFVVIKSFLGPSFTAVTLGIAVLRFRFAMRREGLRLEFARTMPTRPAPAAG